jgi:16S rRNA C967 or C1407 C5-methylase (RsmB/RsmF family)/NOL1/NOP2/fmu family ribosome biogenesis protein
VSEINWPNVLGPILEDFTEPDLNELEKAIGEYSDRAVRAHPSIAIADLPFETEPIPWFDRGRWLIDNKCRPGAFLKYAAGDYYIQDAGSMLALALCNVKPGQWICDTCAAPGGKSSGLLEELRGTGLVVSNEVIRSRLELLELTLARTGHSNYVVVNSEVEALAEMCSDVFDCVIVDAPCTGQSMLARGKQSLAAFSDKQIEHSAARQHRILRAAAELVKPGGRLVYSTCTFAIAENELMIELFRSQHADWLPVQEPKLAAWASPNYEGCYRLWPHRDRCAGAFAAALVRPENAESQPMGSHVSNAKNARARYQRKPSSTQFTQVELGSQDLPWLAPANNQPLQLWQRGQALHYFASSVPGDWLEATNKVSVSGVPVAEQRGGGWQPCYAASVAEFPDFLPTAQFEISDLQATEYMSGATVRLGLAGVEPPAAWATLMWRGRKLAWSKFTGSKDGGGILKNHLPKALRKQNLA